MSIKESYKTVWKNKFDFTSKTSKTDFWSFMIPDILLTIAVVIIHFTTVMVSSPPLLGVENFDYNPSFIVKTFNILIATAILAFYFFHILYIIPVISLCVRRLHDTNRSGIWMLFTLLPVFGWLALFLAFLEEGNSRQKNK